MTGVRTGRRSMKQVTFTRTLPFRTKLSRKKDTFNRHMYYLTGPAPSMNAYILEQPGT